MLIETNYSTALLLCCTQLLERQVYSVAKLCPDQSFLSLCRLRHVSGLRMLYKVNSNSNHCLFSALPSTSVRVRHTKLLLQLIHQSLKCQFVERPNLQGVSSGPGSYWDDLPCTVFGTGTWMCLVNGVVCFSVCLPRVVFFQFAVAQVLVGLRKQFINNLVFHTWAFAAGFKIIIIIIIGNSQCFT